uniref:Concanavalin A-like lectin/glucanases superfamily protein n=1 Tax=Candidatus Kentrum sp. LFY TaxID=2126342 RepID=A0A450WI71_9GAMM|nr:MAG: Concanavalin A-like lectin/glucanases superfamily protein [Candidatus Kentron sp. LFY]
MTKPDFQLPIWLKKGEQVNRLKDAARAWWDRVDGWVRFPLSQRDPKTCHPDILRLMAFERDITPFDGENEQSFRLRVEHAPANVIDAGSREGFPRIFQRLGMELLDQEERFDAENWDVIRLVFADGAITGRDDLLRFIVRQYGRTTRRYEFATYDRLDPAIVAVGSIGTDTEVATMEIPELSLPDRIDPIVMPVAAMDFDFSAFAIPEIDLSIYVPPPTDVPAQYSVSNVNGDLVWTKVANTGTGTFEADIEVFDIRENTGNGFQSLCHFILCPKIDAVSLPDLSGNGHDGIVDQLTFDPNGSDGRGGFYWDGESADHDKIDIPHIDYLDSDFTLQMTVKRIGDGPMGLYTFGAGVDRGFYFMRWDDRLYLTVGHASGPSQVFSDIDLPETICRLTMTHRHVDAAPDIWAIFMDGIQKGTLDADMTAVTPSDQHEAGNFLHGLGQELRGYIDSVQVWKKTLTQDQITASDNLDNPQNNILKASELAPGATYKALVTRIKGGAIVETDVASNEITI